MEGLATYLMTQIFEIEFNYIFDLTFSNLKLLISDMSQRHYWTVPNYRLI